YYLWSLSIIQGDEAIKGPMNLGGHRPSRAGLRPRAVELAVDGGRPLRRPLAARCVNNQKQRAAEYKNKEYEIIEGSNLVGERRLARLGYTSICDVAPPLPGWSAELSLAFDFIGNFCSLFCRRGVSSVFLPVLYPVISSSVWCYDRPGIRCAMLADLW
ncbi:hypothetical protein J6590_014070, partial [Homalodisca vitripennis]